MNRAPTRELIFLASESRTRQLNSFLIQGIVNKKIVIITKNSYKTWHKKVGKLTWFENTRETHDKKGNI